jgi:hypothetical protein
VNLPVIYSFSGQPDGRRRAERWQCSAPGDEGQIGTRSEQSTLQSEFGAASVRIAFSKEESFPNGSPFQ